MASKVDQDRNRDTNVDDEFGSMGEFDNFELDDPFGSLEEPEKGRKPSSPTKDMLISGLSGVGKGLQSGFTAELYKAMPSVQPVVGEISESFQEFKDLKDEVGQKLAPMMRTLEMSARKILPKAQAFLPKKLYEKAKAKLDERAERQASEADYSQTKEQQESEYISQSLNELFSAQMESQQASDIAREQQHLADQAIEAERHDAVLAASGHVYESVRATELFHKTIHTAYLKKSLELKYKHLFIARDTYNLLAESMKSFNMYFQAIQKNTGLPDMVKMQMGDYHRMAMTQEYGQLMANFMGNFRKKIFANIKEKVLGTVSAVGDAVDMLGQGVDMADMASEMGAFNKKNMVAKGVGWALGKFGGSPIFKALAQKYAPMLQSADKRIGGFANTMALKGANLKRNWEVSDNKLLNFLADFLPGLAPQTSGSNDLVTRGEKAATFDTMTRQSIVEIIPGYLSKILHSVDILRTGDENTPQQVYNVYSRKFTGIDELKEGYYDKLYGAEATRRSVFHDALATLQAGVTHNKTTDKPEEYFKKYEKDINRFMLNHAVRAQFLNIKAIGEYLTRGSEDYVSQYIRDVTAGFENPPDDVLRAIYQGCLSEDGDIDKDLVLDLEESINAYRRMDSFKTEMPRLFELYGYRSYLSDKISSKQKTDLQSQVKTDSEIIDLKKFVKTDEEEADLQAKILDEPTTADLQEKAKSDDTATAEAARARLAASEEARAALEKSRKAKSDIDASARAKTKLAATAGLIDDQNRLNLSNMIESQTDINYDDIDTSFTRQRRLDELETSRQAAQQLAELKEKTGYNAVAGWVARKRGKAEEYGKKVVDTAKKKYEKVQTSIEEMGKDFASFASKVVTDPLYREEILSDLETKAADLMAAGKKTGEDVMKLAQEIREDPKAAMEKLGKASKEKFDAITSAVSEKAAEVGKKATEIYEEHVPEETREKISKAAETVKTKATEVAGKVKEKVAEHTPESVKKAVSAAVEAIPTTKEEAIKAAETIKDKVVEAAKAVPTSKKELRRLSRKAKKAIRKHTPKSVREAVSAGKEMASEAFSRLHDEIAPEAPAPAGTVSAMLDDTTLNTFKVFMDSCTDVMKKMDTKLESVSQVLNVAFNNAAAGNKPSSVVDAVMTVNQTILDSLGKERSAVAGAETPALPADLTDEKAETLKEILKEFKFQAEFRTDQLDEWKKHNSEEMGILFDTMATWKGSQEELLQAILAKAGTGGGGPGEPGWNHEQLLSALEQGGYIKKRSTASMIGSAAKSAGKVIGKTAKAVGHYAGTVYAGALKGAGYAMKGAFGLAGNVVNKVAQAAKWAATKPTFVDIYRKGEEGGAPLITARKQERDPGVVFADDGKRVEASKDINRPVKDPVTGNLLITEEDIKAGLSMPDGTPLGKFFGGVGSVLKSYFGVTGAAVAGAFKFAGSVFKTASNVVFGKPAEPYCDVYLKTNMDKPILTRLKQARDPGVVFKDGSRVKYSSDIHEPVYDPVEKDAAGQPIQLISEEDIKTGLVDARGKKIGMIGGTRGLVGATASAIEKLAPFVGKGLKGAGGLYATVFKGLFGLGMGAAKGVGKVIGRIFGVDVGGTDVNKELLEAVKQIRDDVALLAADEREKAKRRRAGDKDGDGDIDGTYADQQQNKKEGGDEGPHHAEHVDVDWRAKAKEREAGKGGKEGGGSGGIFDWVGDLVGKTKWGKALTRRLKIGKYLFKRKGARYLRTAGKFAGKHLGTAGRFLGSKAGMLARAGGHLLTKLPAAGGLAAKLGAGLSGIGSTIGSALGLGGAAAGTAATGAAAAGAGTAAAGAAGTAAAGAAGAGALGTLGAILGPAALAALAGYGIYRGVKGFKKENALKHLGKGQGISNVNQLTGEDRMYSALGMNTKVGAKVAKYTSKFLGIDGLIKGIRGNDNPMTDKEIETGRSKLQRKIAKNMPGYDRILQEYEKAVDAGNWRRARQLSGQKADGLIKSLWKNSLGGAALTAGFKLVFGDKNKEMTQEEIQKVHAKFGSIIEKGGPKAKNAEKLLSKFDDYVSEGDWKNARKIAHMEKRGLFGKLFQDSQGKVQWGKIVGTAALGLPGFLLGSLFDKTDKNKPMTEKEIEAARARLQKLIDNSNGTNKAANRALNMFDEAVKEMDWKKARQLCGEEVQSTLAKAGKLYKSAVKWSTRISTLGLSMLFESDQDKPLKDDEIKAYQIKMMKRAEHGDKLAERKLDKFNEACARQDWSKARAISKMKDESLVVKGVKNTWKFFFGGGRDEPMKEAEITKFRESMQRKIQMGSKAAERKLDAFNQAVDEERWKKARAIAHMPDEGIVQKGAKALGNMWMNQWRFILGGDGKPMSESELNKARAQFSYDIAAGKKGAQKRSDMFEDFVADEKWAKARKLAKMPYENIAKRTGKAVMSFLFGKDDKEMTPEEIDKVQGELEQRIEDGDRKAKKILDRFNMAVEHQNWKKARELAGMKDGGLVGGAKKAAKSVWNFLTGNKDYADCMKLKEKLLDKAQDDETGLIDAGIAQFEKLVKRQKYNDAAKLGKDLLKMKPKALAEKYKLSSDQYEAFKKQAEDLDKKIVKAIESDKSWFSIKKLRLKMLRGDVKNANEWSDDYFEDLRDRYSRITGEDIFGSDDLPVDDRTMKRGQQLIEDVNNTSKKFTWLGSPIIKTRLAALRSEIKSDPSMWDDEYFDEWRDRLKEIAGKDAVVTQPEEWKNDLYANQYMLTKGRKILDKIKTIRDQYSRWKHPFIRKQLQNLYDNLSEDPTTWSEDTFKQILQQVAEVTGGNAQQMENEIDADDSWKEAKKADYEGNVLLKDIAKTSKKFSWLFSPRIKSKLARLRDEVEGEQNSWAKGDTLKEYRERLKEIAGEDAEITKMPKNEAEWYEVERISRQGKQVLEDINNTSAKFSWLFSPMVKRKLSALKAEVEGDETSWDSDKIKEYRNRIKEIAGDDAVVTINEDDMSTNERNEERRAQYVEKQGNQLIQDVEATSKKFGWLKSPSVKWNLSRLKARIEGEQPDWSTKKLKEYKKRLEDIAGKDAVITEVENDAGAPEDDLDEMSGKERVDELRKLCKTISGAIEDMDKSDDRRPQLEALLDNAKLRLKKATMFGRSSTGPNGIRLLRKKYDEIMGYNTDWTEDADADAEMDQIGPRGENLINDIKDTAKNISRWIPGSTIARASFRALATKISMSRSSWSKESLDKDRERYRKMVKFFGIKDAKDTDKEDAEAALDETVLKKGDTLISDIEATKKKFHWWNSEHGMLNALKTEVANKKPEWTDENLEDYRKKLKEVAGDKAQETKVKEEEAEQSEEEDGSATDVKTYEKNVNDLEKKIDQQIKALDKDDPRIADLMNLKRRVKRFWEFVGKGPDAAQFINKKLGLYEKQLDEIVGEDTSVSTGEETAPETGEEERFESPESESFIPEEPQPEPEVVDEEPSEEPPEPQITEEDKEQFEGRFAKGGYIKKGLRLAKRVAKSERTKKLARAVGKYGINLLDPYGIGRGIYGRGKKFVKSDAFKKGAKLAGKIGMGLIDPFGFNRKIVRKAIDTGRGFVDKGEELASNAIDQARDLISDKFGAFVTKAKQAILEDGQTAEVGEDGTEAILPVHNRPGNLLSKLGDKVNDLLHGKDIGPANDAAQGDVVHAADQKAEPVTNLMAGELSKNITPEPKVVEPEKKGGWGDLLLKKMQSAFESKKPQVLQATPVDNSENFAKLIEQNQQLIALLTSVIGDKGLKVAGVADLASSIGSFSGSADSNTNNFSLTSNGGGGDGTGGFDLRKRQM